MNILFRIAGTAFVTSIVFKMLHLQGAGIVLVLSGVLCIAAALTKLIKTRSPKFADFALFAAIVGMTVGYIFKLQHWPYGNEAAIAGTAAGIGCLATGGLGRLLDAVKHMRGQVWARVSFGLAVAVTSVTILFKAMAWPGGNILFLLSAVAWLMWMWVSIEKKQPVKLGLLDEEV